MGGIPVVGAEDPGGRAVDPVVVDLRGAGVRRSRAEADLVVAVRGVVERVQERERERRAGRGGPLTGGSRALSRGVRLAAIGEIEVALGFSAWEAGLLVRAATAAEPLAGMVDAALRAGETTWVQVRWFYEKTASLEDDRRLLVAAALFGDDPGLAAGDRLGPDGDLHGRAWSVPSFRAALDAEVTACRGSDVAAERAARARAYAARRTWTRVHEDGMATLSIRGPVASVLAAGQRLERGARGVRAAGDPRTLGQLGVDVGLGLLTYATVALHGCPDKQPDPAATDAVSGHPVSDDAVSDDAVSGGESAGGVLFDEVIAPQDMELLARVVNGLPPVALQVVLPYSTMAGGFPICGRCSGPLDAPEPRDTGQQEAVHNRPPGAGQDSARRGPPGRSGRGRVGEVLGPNPFFVSEGHARELALMPGTTLHRLVVDPRDGRLVERTIKGYRPDADMRRQVVAADVYSRAPGARARTGELDHVTPYGWAGGPTSEVNLALLAKRPHRYKTEGTWQVEIGARRDLTFTTLLGQVVRTRVHDYRTYLRQVHPDDLEDRRDLAGQLLQAALADRAGIQGRRRGDGLTTEHTDPDTGQTRPGPRPDQPTIDDLLGDEDA
ncbi:hypothetical protein [Ornithinimicrobium avium]|uniref:HNH endonuclease n=1 Tax=Ornithinimicrobium avium TaxID=2283195 RepID=A0A345NJL9_9MICO|nr:hypothetical protein [Ornithinimicrobium avium]AXH95227.1 hypothetical protein DV701_02890 [Ornithinimicrobium avium]